MKRDNLFFKLLILFFLVLVSSLSFADDGASFWGIKSLGFSPAASDLSVGFLMKIFGKVPGVDQFLLGGSTIIGAVFMVFNIGILALSGIFVTYTIAKILTETSMDGSAIGKSTTIWTAIRCSLSTSLLVPHMDNSYSMINSIVMWVVIQSIGLANQTWTTALEFLKGGAPTYSEAKTLDYSLISYLHDTNKAKETNIGAADVLVSLSCSNLVYDALTQVQTEIRNKLNNRGSSLGGQGSDLNYDEKDILSKSNVTIDKRGTSFALYKDDGDSYVFPYIDSSMAKSYGLYTLNKDNQLESLGDKLTKLNGICGIITYKSGTADSSAAQKASGLTAMIGSLDKIAEDMVSRAKEGKLDPTAHVILNSNNSKIYLQNPKDPYSSTVTNFDGNQSNNLIDTLNWPFDSQNMVAAATSYQSALSGVTQGINNSSNNVVKDTVENAKKQGWIGAGGYYRSLASAQAKIAGEIKGGDRLTTPIERAATLGSFALNSQASQYIGDLGTDHRKYLIKIVDWVQLSKDYSKLLAKYLVNSVNSAGNDPNQTRVLAEKDEKNYLGAFTKYTSSSINGKIIGIIASYIIPISAVICSIIFQKLPVEILFYNIGEIMTTWFENINDKSLDPIIKLQNLGDKMIEVSLNSIKLVNTLLMGVYGVIISANFALSIGSTILAAATGNFWGIGTGASVALDTLARVYSDLGAMAQTFLNMQMPILLSIMGPILVSGIILTVYVPVIPYLLFLFGAISWIISVLILMAAAPIICFLMLWGNSSQENPLLSREAEQFVMQIVGVFFRPTLMIIGLIAGVMLSYVGVDILNLGFSNMFKIILQDSSGSETLQAIKIAGAVVIYTFTMVSIVNMCFSSIHMLYSEAMRVAGISAPAVGMEEKQTEAVKGSVTQFAEAGSAGAKESSGAFQNKGSAELKINRVDKKKKGKKGAKGNNSKDGG